MKMCTISKKVSVKSNLFMKRQSKVFVFTQEGFLHQSIIVFWEILKVIQDKYLEGKMLASTQSHIISKQFSAYTLRIFIYLCHFRVFFFYCHANIVGILLIISIDTNFACSCHNFHYHYFHHYCLSLPLISSFSFNSFNVYWYSYCIWLLLNLLRIQHKHADSF